MIGLREPAGDSVQDGSDGPPGPAGPPGKDGLTGDAGDPALLEIMENQGQEEKRVVMVERESSRITR